MRDATSGEAKGEARGVTACSSIGTVMGVLLYLGLRYDYGVPILPAATCGMLSGAGASILLLRAYEFYQRRTRR
ncbi:MAG: hypothetical protein AAF311_02215 [Pseudomonadota bacterium]